MPNNTLQMIVCSNIAESTNKENRDMSRRAEVCEHCLFFFVSVPCLFVIHLYLKSVFILLYMHIAVFGESLPSEITYK